MSNLNRGSREDPEGGLYVSSSDPGTVPKDLINYFVDWLINVLVYKADLLLQET
jgi:hypothetical protein